MVSSGSQDLGRGFRACLCGAAQLNASTHSEIRSATHARKHQNGPTTHPCHAGVTRPELYATHPIQAQHINTTGRGKICGVYAPKPMLAQWYPHLSPPAPAWIGAEVDGRPFGGRFESAINAVRPGGRA